MALAIKIPGRNTAFAVDGFDLSNNFNEYKLKRDANLIDATGFGQRISYDLAGIQKATLEMKGYYTPGTAGTNALDNVAFQRLGQDSDVEVLLAPNGWTLLSPTFLIPTVMTKWDIDAKNKDAVMVDSEFAARGAVDYGYMLSDPRTPITATGASSVLDYTNTTGATAQGCSAQMHILLPPGGTTPSITGKIQHCATVGGSYVDLMTFTAATTQSAQRLSLDASFGTIQPCIKFSYTVSGTLPVFNIACAFARGIVYS